MKSDCLFELLLEQLKEIYEAERRFAGTLSRLETGADPEELRAALGAQLATAALNLARLDRALGELRSEPAAGPPAAAPAPPREGCVARRPRPAQSLFARRAPAQF